MAYTTINKSTDYFNTKLYTGDGNATNAITGVGFQPDWVWIKNRGTTARHVLFDAVRGSQKAIFSHLTDAEQSTNQYGTLNSFDSDGFTVADGSSSGERTNNSSENYVSWNWRAGNSSGSSNSDGSITSTVSANTTSGFSIVKYTGTGANATVGHGLGVAPRMVIIKNTSTAESWIVGHKSLGFTKFLSLDATNAAQTTSNRFNDTDPTSSVFSVGSADGTNKSGDTIIAYCFAEKTGFSKFGKYTGNANADGPFVYTGFKPEFIMMKESNNSGQGWCMKTNSSNERVGNPNDYFLKADTTDVENTSTSFQIDMLSNGFKIRTTDGIMNGSSDTFIYMAFAAAPLVGSNNVPCTAR